MQRRNLMIGAALAGLLGPALSAEATTLRRVLEETGANALFLRHAIAPGFGDPENFRVGNCATQRNLSGAGREQARRIGATIRAADLGVAAVLSSQWCRCLDTARLLDLGPVTPFSGLNSFFQDHANRAVTLPALQERLVTLPAGGLTVLVTHQVVIRAVTGLSVPSGGAVAYAPQSGQAAALDLG